MVVKEKGAAGRRIYFVGWCVTRNNVRLRKSIKKNFARKMKHSNSRKAMASYYGWCKWCNGNNLWNKITKDMSFADKGIKCSSTTKDGKKFFDVAYKKMYEITNVPLTIIDFESNIKTPNGNDRYEMKFQMSGETYKTCTNSFKIKEILKQAGELEKSGQKIFPVENVIIRRRSIDGEKCEYYFEE